MARKIIFSSVVLAIAFLVSHQIKSQEIKGGLIAGLGNTGVPLTPANGGVGAMTSAPFWLRYLGDGNEGAYSCPSGNCTLNDEHWYSSVSVASGATVYINASTDPLVMRSTGTCTVAGTISVSPTTDSGATGITGGSNHGGGGGGGGGGTLAGANGSGGSLGNGGTGGGITGGNATNGTLENIRHFQYMIGSGMLPFLSGTVGANIYGGSQGGTGGSSGGTGGKGAQVFILVCPTINFTGTIDASGQVGGNSTGNNVGPGGGGGGGVVIMSAITYSANTGTISLSGGAGGSCGAFTGCGTAGTGGSGRSAQYTIQ